MVKKWFTSGTHFGSERVRKLSNRPFKNVEEMDYELIKRWNSVVAKGDIVYHLGDFGEYKNASKLNGNIKLLAGNYEMKESGYDIDEFSKILRAKVLDYDIVDTVCAHMEKIESFGFTRVFYNCGGSLPFVHTKELSISAVHRPRDRDINEFTVFGHIHALQTVKKNALNVGVDCHNFYPIDLEKVLFYKNCIENIYDFDVFSE